MDLVAWATQHTNLLGLLFGSGIVTTGVTALGRRWIRHRTIRRERARGVETFPFEVFRPGMDPLPIVMPGPEKSFFLPPSAIGYQERTLSKSSRQEIADRLLGEEQRWMLLAGPTGTGKTREAVEVSRLLMQQGWTVLYLTRDNELDLPATPPEQVPRRKLLFLLDDLNRRISSSHDAAGAADPDNPLHAPLQVRLLRTLRRYEDFYGEAEVRVLATARNETEPACSDKPSEWDKLNIPRYREFWDRFGRPWILPEPDDEVVRRMLETTSQAANVAVPDAGALARNNDRTFENIVANLQRARANGTELTLQNFQGTLQGTWEKRFEDADRHSPRAASKVFGAVSILRELGAPLTVESVTEMAVVTEPSLSSRAGPLALERRRVRQEVQRLWQTADILHPRDGQIEASGPWGVERRHVAVAADYVVALSRDDPRAAWPHLLQVGRSALIRRYFHLAVTLYTKALELNPEDAQAWYGQGKAFAGARDFSRAVESYRASLARVEDFYWAWYDLGIAQLALHKFAEAADSLGSAKGLRPIDHMAWINRARALAGAGDLEGAYREYEEALAIRPNAAAALRGRDEVLSFLPPGESLRSGNWGAEPGPEDCESWRRRGNLLLAQGAFAEAASAFRAALASNENHADAWYGLGLACMLGNGPEDPIACFDRALNIDPYFYWAHFDLGNARRFAGDHEAALAHYEAAIRCQPEYADAWYGKGISLAQLGRHQEAVRHYKQAIALDTDFPTMSYDLGNSLRELGYAAAAAGDRASAERCFGEGLAAYKEALADGEHAGARHGLGLCYFELGRYEDAVIQFNRAIDADPGAAWHWYDKGRALSAAGRHPEAVDAFRRALDLDSTYPQALYEMSRAEARRGHVGAAVQALEAAIPLRPERYPDKALTDSAFDTVRGDERFSKLFENRSVRPVPGGGL